MCPSANTCWRSALMLEMAHVELLSRNIPAFQHSQHRGERFNLHVPEPEFLCRLEILCKHDVLLFSSCTTYTRSHDRRELRRPRCPENPHCESLSSTTPSLPARAR